MLPDVGSEMAELEQSAVSGQLSAEDIQHKKDEILTNYSVKSERVHTVNQLLKAYTLFEKDVDYIIDNGEVKTAAALSPFAFACAKYSAAARGHSRFWR